MADKGNWIGGDIAGLHGMAQSLSAAPDAMHDVVTALSSKVKGLNGDVGWQGDAANQFSKKWSADSVTAGSLAEATKAIGEALGELASTLEAIDGALYNAAHEARAQGVPIGPDGKPPTVATPANPSPADGKMLAALRGYVDDYNRAMEDANAGRLVAEEKLNNIYDAIGPDGQDGAKATTSQALTVGGYVRALYAIPASRTRDILKDGDAQLAAAKEVMRETRPAYRAAKQEYAEKGLKLPKDDPARVEHSKAANELRNLESKIDAAGKGELTNPVSSALDTRVDDLGKLGSGAGRLPKFLQFAKELPVVSIAATAAGAAIDTHADMQKGDSLQHAAGVNAATGVGGLAAGVGAGALIAAAPVDVPVIAAVSAGAVVAVGAGDMIKEGLNEHWAEDIHRHGLVGGVGTGVKNMVVNTGKDLSGMAAGIWHTVAG